MKHLQSFSLFEARASRLPSGLTPDQESFLNLYTKGTWSVNPTTGLVDVQGNFYCYARRLKSLQGILGISFGHVSENFYFYGNQLTTLAGAPNTVGKDFSCYGNHLTTLEGAPTKVDGGFSCKDNRLTTLEGAPTTVNGDFYCEGNQLTTLEGAPTKVNGNFYCEGNQLTTLEGAPATGDGGFYCSVFRLKPGEWNPTGWAKILATGDDAARRLILTLPFFDADLWLQRLAGDLKKDGQVLLQLAALWEEPGWENQRQEISQRLSSDQLRAIKVLKTKLDYVDPWQDFRF